MAATASLGITGSDVVKSDDVPAAPSRGLRWLHAAALWLGPPIARADASITAGVLWLATLIAALWAAPAVFGLTVSAVAALGAWQAASVSSIVNVSHIVDTAPEPSRDRDRDRDQSGLAMVGGDPRLRLPASALAGAVGFAGVVDTPLVGAVLGAAVIASFIVVGSLRLGRVTTSAAQHRRDTPVPVLAQTGLLIRCWMQVGLAAACAAAVARYSTGAALVLVTAAAAYDAGAYVTAAERQAGLRGPCAGAVSAAAVVFAMTGLSVPPFAPADALPYGVIAALAMPLGPALARAITHAQRVTDPAGHHHQRRFQRALAPPRSAWAVRRLDSLSIASPVWMWGLGLLTI